MMKLMRTRECDGSCCRAAAQFPNEDRTGCIYQENNVCVLQRDNELPVEEICPANPHMTGEEAFINHCVNWPHNTNPDDATGDCCWQWVDE